MLHLLDALKTAWDGSTLPAACPGGIHAQGEVPPGAQRPYVVATPLTDALLTRTNRGSYPRAGFQLEVQADDLSTATTVAYALQALLLAGVALDGGERLLFLTCDDFTWEEEDQFWRVILDCNGTLARSRAGLIT